MFSPFSRSHGLFTWALVAMAGLSAISRSDVTFTRPKDGKVKETVEYSSKVQIWPTDAQGRDIVGTDWITGKKWPIEELLGAGTSKEWDIPKSFSWEGGNKAIKDIHQRVTRESGDAAVLSTGAFADLSIESIRFDPTANAYVLENIFGRLFDTVGPLEEVAIPDLFADVNEDGHLDGSDGLYSLVDLYVYLDNIPTFTFADQYQIVNGTTPALAGMLFSTTPFVFDPSSGFQYTAFTGTGTVDAQHGVTGVPESTSLLLVTITASTIGVHWCLRSRSTRRSELDHQGI